MRIEEANGRRGEEKRKGRSRELSLINKSSNKCVTLNTK